MNSLKNSGKALVTVNCADLFKLLDHPVINHPLPPENVAEVTCGVQSRMSSHPVE